MQLGVTKAGLLTFVAGVALVIMALCPAALASAGAVVPAPDKVAPAQESKPVVLLAHRALYRLSLDSVRNGGHVQDAAGQMVFEWQDACNGWNVMQRLNLDITRDEGFEVRLKSNFTTWESRDGKQYRFNYINKLNDAVQEQYRGEASLDAPGGAGKAVYTVPENREVALPKGSYFPTSHTLMLIDRAQGHAPLFTASVFDGTDERGYSEISAVIGGQKDVSVELAKTGLNGQPAIAWPIRMAFFSQDQEEAEPDYEMDTTLLPNGVSEFMLMDYGEFRLKGTLEKIELLPQPRC